MVRERNRRGRMDSARLGNDCMSTLHFLGNCGTVVDFNDLVSMKEEKFPSQFIFILSFGPIISHHHAHHLIALCVVSVASALQSGYESVGPQLSS